MAPVETWDAIMIGSGLGGLSAAAVLVNAGKRVLILERLGNFGGAATVYRHGPLTIEASLHETDGGTLLSEHGAFSKLGVRDGIEPIATESFYNVRGGPLREPVRVPHGLAAAREAVRSALPEDNQAIEQYFAELQQLNHGIGTLEAMPGGRLSALYDLIVSGDIIRIVADARRTVAQRFDAIFGDSEAPKFVLGAPLAYFDDDPASLSFLFYAGVWSRYADAGSYYVKGGSGAISRALMQHIASKGGEAVRHAKVVRLLVDANEAVSGVVFSDANGTEHERRAPVVLAGAAPAAVAAMLPERLRDDFLKPFASFEPSISLFTVSLGLSRPAADFGLKAYSTFVFPDGMRKFTDYPQAAAVFSTAPCGRYPPYAIANYGALDSGMRQDSDPWLVSLTGVDRLEWWRGLSKAEEQDRRARWMQVLIADVDRHFPGFSGAVTQSEIATARTMKSFLGTPNGEVYGFRPTPQRLFGRQPQARTSIEGLFLASAYTISGGYAGAIQGGMMAAQAALRKLKV